MQHTVANRIRSPLYRPKRLLELDYAPEVPMDVLEDLEKEARRLGLPLHQLELLGQDAAIALGFAAASREGLEEEFIEQHVDWALLEARLNNRPPVRN